jgi:soluble P-type ATPase
LCLEHLLLDVNGTLTDRGELLDGVDARLGRLTDTLDIRLVSADTFGTLDAIASRLTVGAVPASTGEDKLRLLDELGRDRCAVVGNGANDALVLEAAALGVVIIGPEGASAAALRSADVVCASATDALDLLLDPRALSATLRL